MTNCITPPSSQALISTKSATNLDIPLDYEQTPLAMNESNISIQMDAQGKVSILHAQDADASWSRSLDISHGRTLEWRISPELSESEILARIEDNLALFEKVHAGHVVESNDSGYTGTLTPTAREACETLRNRLDGADAIPEHLADLFESILD